jgi:hypothetical protein
MLRGEKFASLIIAEQETEDCFLFAFSNYFVSNLIEKVMVKRFNCNFISTSYI